MKSKEELEALKKEIEELSKKLSELTEDELKEIGGRAASPSELTDEQMGAISGGAPVSPYRDNVFPILSFIIGTSVLFLAPAADEIMGATRQPPES